MYFCIFFVFHFHFKYYFLWGRWQVCFSVTFLFLSSFVGRFFCHDSRNLLSVVGWLRSSSSLFSKDCSSLNPDAYVKILVSVFDIFRSVFEYESTNYLCQPRLLEYVLLMYSATAARSSVLSSFSVLKNSSTWVLVNFVSAFLWKCSCSFSSASSKIFNSLFHLGTSKSSLKSFIA